jgi:hypothetical protein
LNARIVDVGGGVKPALVKAVDSVLFVMIE